MKRGLSLIVLLSLTLTLPALSQTTIRFSATVNGGEKFAQTLRQGLVFVLDPVHDQNLDWELTVKPSEGSDTNYARCVNPPLHGPTPMDIETWHWMPDAQGKSWDSIPSVRKFDFVLNEADNLKACDELDRVANDVERGRNQVGDPNYKDPPLGHARVTIRSVEIKPKTADGEARFAKISFNAIITLPAGSGPHR